MDTNNWKDTWVYLNGDFVKGEEATVSLLEWSFLYGDAIYEGVSVSNGKILNLEPHIDRMYLSAKRVGIEIPISKNNMEDVWVKTVRKNNMTDGYFRPLVSRGNGPIGIHNIENLDGPNIYVIPQTDREGSYNEVESAKARIASIRAPSPVSRDPRIKANQYLPNILAVREIKNTPADIPIFLNDDGYVTEAGAANIFTVHDNNIRTPPRQQILNGTTRDTVIDIIENLDDFSIDVCQLTPYDLYTGDECFVTGSLKGVKSITKVNNTNISDGNIGKITELINERLRSYLHDSGKNVFQ